MKRIVTMDDLTLLVNRASTLRKLAKSAQQVCADLAVEQQYMKAADESIGRGCASLGNEKLTSKQRKKIENQIERDQQFFECAQSEYGKKSSGYSALVSEIEGVLREFAATYVAERH
jgi:hypothetical protein